MKIASVYLEFEIYKMVIYKLESFK